MDGTRRSLRKHRLQTLDKNHDLYADFDLLDDLDLQQNVVATP